MGAVHLLEAARQVGTVKAMVYVTTDQCYENREWLRGYQGDQPLGGHDPCSSSMGCSGLVTSTYRRSLMAEAGIAVASARAGNAIGVGDWSQHRLIPVTLTAFEKRSGRQHPQPPRYPPLATYTGTNIGIPGIGAAALAGWSAHCRSPEFQPGGGGSPPDALDCRLSHECLGQ